MVHLERWFRAHGGSLRPSVRIAFDDNFGFHLRVSPDQDIPPNLDLLRVPHSLTFSLLDYDRLGLEWPEAFISHFADAPEVLTRFLLIDQLLQREDSFWWPYLDLLPRPARANDTDYVFETPLWYGEEDYAWIKGTNLDAARTRREAEWRNEYERGLELLGECKHPLRKLDSYDWYVTFAPTARERDPNAGRVLYKWAATVLTSRCFSSTMIAGNQTPSESQSSLESPVAKIWGIKESGVFPVLFPILDLANHDPGARVTWTVHAESVILTTADRIKAGTQLFNNYSPKGNEERK